MRENRFAGKSKGLSNRKNSAHIFKKIVNNSKRVNKNLNLLAKMQDENVISQHAKENTRNQDATLDT